MGTWVDGAIEGPGQIMYPRVRYHGSWYKGVPKGPGCFVFDTNCMQHGFYLLTKDPDFEEFGEGEEEKDDKDKEKLEEGEEEIEIDETLGDIFSFHKTYFFLFTIFFFIYNKTDIYLVR